MTWYQSRPHCKALPPSEVTADTPRRERKKQYCHEGLGPHPKLLGTKVQNPCGHEDRERADPDRSIHVNISCNYYKTISLLFKAF